MSRAYMTPQERRVWASAVGAAFAGYIAATSCARVNIESAQDHAERVADEALEALRRLTAERGTDG